MAGTAAILAGGASRRFGSPKALHMINGRPMITIVGDRLQKLFDNVFIAGFPSAQFAPAGLTCLPDRYVGKGALGGIHTALTNTTDQWVFCCGCDMPLVQAAVIYRITESIRDEDILLPVIGGVRQPLHAVYNRRILPIVEHLCAANDAYLPDLFTRANVRCLEDDCFADIPGYALSFVGLNDRHQIERYATELSTL